MRGFSARCITVAGIAAGLAAASPAHAESAKSREEQLQAQLDEMRAREAASQARIETLERRLQAIEAAIGTGPVSDATDAEIRGRGAPSGVTAQRIGDTVVAQGAPGGGGGSVPPATNPANPANAANAANEDVAQGEPDRKTPAPSEAVETVTRNEQGYFGDRLSFEGGLTYSHFDDAQLNLSGFLALDSIFLGLISVDQTTADVFVTDATIRYGLTPRLQIDVNVPYLYRHSNFQSGGAGGDASGVKEADVHDSGMGDVNFGASYRLIRETVNRPDIVLNARVKIPTGRDPFGTEVITVPGSEGNLQVPAHLSTGSGVWAASAGISVLKTLDPIVVFGSISYFHNFNHHFGDLDEAAGNQPGRARVGDALQFGAGLAFALNERSSISLAFTERVVERTELKRDTASHYGFVVGSQANVGIFNIGSTFSLTQKLSLITTIGIGMTSDAPDMLLSIRLPFRF